MAASSPSAAGSRTTSSAHGTMPKSRDRLIQAVPFGFQLRNNLLRIHIAPSA